VEWLKVKALSSSPSTTKKKKKAVSTVNRAGAVCNQNTFKFFVSHWKDSMTGHLGVKRVF
jgi:hypothetical protein